MLFNMIVYKTESGEPLYSYIHEDVSAIISAAMKALDVSVEHLIGQPISVAKTENVEMYAIREKCITFLFIMDDEFLSENSDIYCFMYTLTERFKQIYGKIIEELYCKGEARDIITLDFFKGFNEVIKDFLELRAYERFNLRESVIKESVIFETTEREFTVAEKSTFNITYRISNLYSRPIKLLYLEDAYPDDICSAGRVKVFTKGPLPVTEEEKILGEFEARDSTIYLGEITVEPLSTCYARISVIANYKKIAYVRPKLIFIDNSGIRRVKYALNFIVIVS